VQGYGTKPIATRAPVTQAQAAPVTKKATSVLKRFF
jgi:hypothetical protein